MRKINLLGRILTVIGILLSHQLTAQYGFLGKKNIIGASVMANSPLFSGNYFTENYRYRDMQLIETKERLNFGYALSYSRQLSSSKAIGAEYLLKQYLVQSPTYYRSIKGDFPHNVTLDTSFLRMEQLEVNTQSFLITAEFSSKNGIGPVGIAHKLGLGYSLSFIVDKAYKYTINEFGNTEEYQDSWTAPDNYFIKADVNSVKSITGTYELLLRLPINEQFCFETGIKYLFSYYLPMSDEVLHAQDFSPVSFSQVYNDMKRENFMSINLKAGLSFLF